MKQLALSQAVGMFLVLLASRAQADVFQWEYIDPADPNQGKRPSTTLAHDGAGVDAAPGVDVSFRNLTKAYLTGAELMNADGLGSNLTDADLSHSKLTHAYLWGATLTDANFRDADVQGTSFVRWGVLGTGLTLPQLYSTASYQSNNLSGIHLSGNRLAGGCFAGQDLTNAIFNGYLGANADLRGANFTAADARGAELTSVADAIAINLIQPDGHISGLDLHLADLLVVRDYDGDPRYAKPSMPITVDQHLSIGPGGTLRMVFEADAWDSTISFAPGVPVALGGTLELTFADSVNPASQFGRTFRLFDWAGVAPTGALVVSSPHAWDLSSLYATGEVTLAAIPESASFVLAAGAFSFIYSSSRRKYT